ncbi:MAG: class I SAM-dependent methyltransferase [Gammaproteobacteria bacterium]|nr:class I SAM-dependent methyltransferase [Gammaproteobacteria bacterium]
MTEVSPAAIPASHQAPAAACRFCGAGLVHTFVDLGMSPLCQTQIARDQLDQGENFYPLHVYVCDRCWLVQLREYVRPDVIFSRNYPYFSSFSDSWVEHARRYVEETIAEFGLGRSSFVVELASNDGYLLQHVVRAGIRCLGVEPTASTATAAVAKGIPTLQEFFGVALARRVAAEQGQADLVCGNNVLAHVPDLNDFVAGIAALLKPGGVGTFEFPHLLRLMENNQFDTIYHEHFSYFSLTTIRAVFARHGLDLFDVRELATHGGSIRIYVQPRAAGRPVHPRVGGLLAIEEQAGLTGLAVYGRFQERVHATKRELLGFLIGARNAGKRVAGYGAPGKGNTLLNYCGIGTDLLDFTVDRNPAKKGTWTPGTRIPILDPDVILERRPDYVLILPWNLKDEITRKMAAIRDWGGQFVLPIPTVEIV